MKKLLLLLFSLMLSFNSYGEWTLTYGWDNGDSAYVDLETIKEINGYVYWWELKNFPSGEFEGNKSVMIYAQGDCEMSRYKTLSMTLFKEAMGQGESTSWDFNEWEYPRPDTQIYQVLIDVCTHKYR
jgi:hypothetical protein